MADPKEHKEQHDPEWEQEQPVIEAIESGELDTEGGSLDVDEFLDTVPGLREARDVIRQKRKETERSEQAD